MPNLKNLKWSANGRLKDLKEKKPVSKAQKEVEILEQIIVKKSEGEA